MISLEQTINELKKKLQSQQAQFERYKTQCKQLQQLLEEESNKKQEQIRKLKQQAIMKDKNSKAMINQLESQNNALKAQLSELKQKSANNQQPVVDTTSQFKKKIQMLNGQNQKLAAERDSLQQKIKFLQSKSPEPQQKGKYSDGQYKKLEQALSNSKTKIYQLEKIIDKLKQQNKNLMKQPDNQQSEKDNKQQFRLRQKIQKLHKKLLLSQSQSSRAQQRSIKLSKQVRQLKQKLSTSQIQKLSLYRKLKQLSYININNSSSKKQQMMQNNEQNQQQQFMQQNKQQSHLNMTVNNLANTFSALMMTKKHYSSPFLEFRNDNSVKLFKSTKNGCFQKSLGSIRYKLNQISYHPEELIENCAKTVIDNVEKGVKNSIIFFGSKKTTKKYLMASLVTKLKDFIMNKVSQSEQQLQAIFVKASPDPQKRIQMVGHKKQQVQQILNQIIEIAQKSPKKLQQNKKKTAPKPKARYFKISQGSLYIEIITTSFTNIVIRDNQNINQVLNNIAYSRLPNALQPTDCYRHIILTLNPIVILYEDCKNTLAIVNSKKSNLAESINQSDQKNSPIKQQLNDTARKKLESIQRQSEQSQLKIRRQQEQIFFYKSKFDQLELRLKNLLNTHRQQNTYLRKSPITLSYEKMLKFVHAVQAKNPTLNTQASTSKFNQGFGNVQQISQQENVQNSGNEGQGEQDIL